MTYARTEDMLGITLVSAVRTTMRATLAAQPPQRCARRRSIFDRCGVEGCEVCR